MKLDVSSSEAAGELCRVPVCVGCHRPATGSVRKRLSNAAGSTDSGSGSGNLLDLVIVLVGAVVAWRRWAASEKTWVEYPACWRHRWLNRPNLRLERATGGRVVLDGVSTEFFTGWEAARSVRGGHAEPGATAEGRGT